MRDRRIDLIEAGLEILREEGLAGFAQAKVAARANLKQGHLTYYFPTRTALLAAVARVAIDRQLAAAEQMISASKNPLDAVRIIATVIGGHENTRLLVALNQAADQEDELRALFNELTDGFCGQLKVMLSRFGLLATEASVDLIHAMFVGLSVIDLATSRPRGEERSSAALTLAFQLLGSARPDAG
ncbi:MAG TPA: TetR family transcriptional regulator [Ensifer sp.]|jgi:AcrR family transcriptional regulator|uniref:TetR/AcrR family transcriptional regulator n=1 Tax=Ensifer sp. TaxID=1872086 RepID=UPI002E0FC819|nr:TetR family transcriptional regulator [Ensifer sp.]